MVTEVHRRFPVGAEVQTAGGVHFRVWAPLCQNVQVVVEGDSSNSDDSQGSFELVREANGYFSGLVTAAENGTLYQYRLEGRAEVYPDPASRFQPKGPHGPSEIVDPGLFTWTDQAWPGVSIEGQTIVRDAHRNLYPGRHLGERYPRASGTRGPRCNGAGGDARSRIPRQFRLGIRRRESLCSDASYTDGLTIFADSWTKPIPWEWVLFLTLCTTTLARTATISLKFSDDYFTDRYADGLGKGDQF